MVLDEAINDGDRNQPAGQILLRAMKLSEQPYNMVDFYQLLSKATEEARSLKDYSKISRYLQKIEDLNQVFVVYHVWKAHWSTFADHIDARGILIALDALANYLHSETPAIFLEQDFLENLNNEFESLLSKILNSSLSKEMKRFLAKRLENILYAIHRYHIDGTEGLENAAQALVSDLVMTEHKIRDEDKKNPVYISVKAWAISLLLYIAPSPYDIIGAVPDIYDFWIPKFEQLAESRKEVEQIICTAPNIQATFEEASNTLKKRPQRSIEGSEKPKALPPSSQEDVKSTENNDSDS